MRMKRVLRGACIGSQSGQSYLAVGGFMAVSVLMIPGAGPFLSVITLGVIAVIAGALLTIGLLGAAIGSLLL